MSGKTTFVTLKCDALNVTQEFEVSHAERLLRLRDNGGWELPQNSKFEFKDNAIKFRTNKKEDCRAKEKGGN